MNIREATGTDNEALLELTHCSPMPGFISLRIDRAPDFFALLRLRGPGKTFVAVTTNGVVGSISVSHRTGFVNGRPQPIGYVGDLKVDPAHRGGRVAYRLLHAAREYAAGGEADVYLCLVAGGNDGASSLLRGVAGIPRFEPIGRFLVSALLPAFRTGGAVPYEIRSADPEDVPAMTALANQFNARYELAPLLSQEEVLPSVAGGADAALRPLLASTGGRIAAMVVPFDTRREKTNVVVGMPPPLRLATGALERVSAYVPLLVPPRMGEPLRMLYVRHAACEAGHEAALRVLVRRVRAEARARQYSLVMLGLHERDPLQSVVARMPRFTFISRGFVLGLRGRVDLVAHITRGIPAEDFALV